MKQSKITFAFLLALILSKGSNNLMANPVGQNDTVAWKQVGLTGTLVNTFAVMGTNLFAGTDGQGVFLSTDSGSTWTAVNNGLPTNTSILSFAIEGTDLFAAIDGNGVFLSTNKGSSWTAIDNGLTSPFVLSLASNDTNLFAGTYGGLWGTTGGGVFRSTNGGANWIEVNNGLTILRYSFVGDYRISRVQNVNNEQCVAGSPGSLGGSNYLGTL